MHGYAAAGGSDIATCCDFIVMEDKARIGYMPVRVWGCPTPAMWVYRLDTVERYRKLVLQEKVEVVLGGISTGVTLALGPVAEDMGTPWLSWDGTMQRGRRGNDADHEVGLPERGTRSRPSWRAC